MLRVVCGRGGSHFGVVRVRRLVGEFGAESVIACVGCGGALPIDDVRWRERVTGMVLRCMGRT